MTLVMYRRSLFLRVVPLSSNWTWRRWLKEEIDEVRNRHNGWVISPHAHNFSDLSMCSLLKAWVISPHAHSLSVLSMCSRLESCQHTHTVSQFYQCAQGLSHVTTCTQSLSSINVLKAWVMSPHAHSLSVLLMCSRLESCLHMHIVSQLYQCVQGLSHVTTCTQSLSSINVLKAWVMSTHTHSL